MLTSGGAYASYAATKEHMSRVSTYYSAWKLVRLMLASKGKDIGVSDIARMLAAN